MMGEGASTVAAAGGEVVGVIPERLKPREVSGETSWEEIVVKDMHERKATMEKLSDGFISLPGGFGTLEETFEIIAWQQLGYHKKPIGLLNVDGFYDGLSRFVDHATSEGFIRDEYRNIMLTADDPAKLLDTMASYDAPTDVVTRITSGRFDV